MKRNLTSLFSVGAVAILLGAAYTPVHAGTTQYDRNVKKSESYFTQTLKQPEVALCKTGNCTPNEKLLLKLLKGACKRGKVSSDFVPYCQAVFQISNAQVATHRQVQNTDTVKLKVNREFSNHIPR